VLTKNTKKSVDWIDTRRTSIGSTRQRLSLGRQVKEEGVVDGIDTRKIKKNSGLEPMTKRTLMGLTDADEDGDTVYKELR